MLNGVAHRAVSLSMVPFWPKLVCFHWQYMLLVLAVCLGAADCRGSRQLLAWVCAALQQLPPAVLHGNVKPWTLWGSMQMSLCSVFRNNHWGVLNAHFQSALTGWACVASGCVGDNVCDEVLPCVCYLFLQQVVGKYYAIYYYTILCYTLPSGRMQLRRAIQAADCVPVA